MNGPARVVLGFYAGEDEYAQKVWSAIRSITPRVQYFHSHGDAETPKPFSSRYAALRLPDEALIVAEVGRDRLPSVLNILRTSGDAALFVARVESPARNGEKRAEAHPTFKAGAPCWTVSPNTRPPPGSARRLLEADRLDHTVNESARWLMDNAHLLRTRISEIRRDLPRGFRRRLARFMTPDGNLHYAICPGA